MIVKVSFQFNMTKYELTFDEKDEKETLQKAIVLSNPPRYCHVCKNTSYFNLEANKAQAKDGSGTFTYINVVCMAKDCYAKAGLGEYKTGGYFWKKFEKYQKSTNDIQKSDSEELAYKQSMSLQEPP